MVLEPLHLGAEHIRERGAEHAAEGHQLFSQTTDPEIDGFHPSEGWSGIGARRRKEGRGIRLTEGCLIKESLGCSPSGGIGASSKDAGVGSVGGDEIDERPSVAKVLAEVVPAGVRPQGAVGGVGKEQPTGLIEARDAILAAAGDVEGTEVEGQAHQVVAQGLGDEFINLLTDLVGGPVEKGSNRVFNRRATGGKCCGVEERFDQPHGRRNAGGGIDPIHRVGEHRVAEAIDNAGELKHHRWIDRAVVPSKDVNGRQQLATELFKDKMLILHLVGKSSRLEQTLPIPLQRCNGCGRRRNGKNGGGKPLVQQWQVVGSENISLDRLNKAVVLRMKDVVNGCQSNVLIAATIARDVMKIEQFVVIGAGSRGSRCCIDHGVRIWSLSRRRHRVVGDVIQKGMAGTQGAGRADRRRRRTLDKAAILQNQLGEAVGTGDEVAVEICQDQGNIADIAVSQCNAQMGTGLLLDLAPVGDRICRRTINEATRCHGTTIDEQVIPQEGLMGRMGGVGLVLVNPGRGRVGEQPHVIGGAEHTIGTWLKGRDLGAGQHHEIGGAAGHIEGVVGLQRNDDRTVASLADQIKAMVKELTEEGEQRVVGR